MKDPDAVLTWNLASSSLLCFPQLGHGVLASILPSFTFLHCQFYDFLSNKPSSRVNTKGRIFSVTVFAGEVHALQMQAVCGFHVFSVIGPSSVFASGNLGVDFLGFSRYTAMSDAKCDRAFCHVCLSMHSCIYLISFFFLITWIPFAREMKSNWVM